MVVVRIRHSAVLAEPLLRSAEPPHSQAPKSEHELTDSLTEEMAEDCLQLH